MSGGTRPAFYALAPGGWRDYVTLLHPPYTLWHLSYVAIGAALAPQMKWGLLGWTTLAFLLAMGVGAHALDELNGRPLRTRIPAALLVSLAVVSIAAACAIGLVVAARTTWWLTLFIAIGAFVVVAYNLELFRGVFHSNFWFATMWGAFPVLTAYFVSAERLHAEAVLAALFAVCASLAQRTLSTVVRAARREAGDVARARPPELALQLLAAAMPLLAGALLLSRSGGPPTMCRCC
jgi:4-hydroxybenzoate polyprenyltransferase